MLEAIRNFLMRKAREKIGATSSLAFKTEDEIVLDILSKISDAQRCQAREIKFKDLIGLHHTMGRAIRNEYGLWDDDNPHVDKSDPMGPAFPDQVSQRIIERVWISINGTPSELQTPV